VPKPGAFTVPRFVLKGDLKWRPDFLDTLDTGLAKERQPFCLPSDRMLQQIYAQSRLRPESGSNVEEGVLAVLADSHRHGSCNPSGRART
jgi:hypothetical protein